MKPLHDFLNERLLVEEKNDAHEFHPRDVFNNVLSNEEIDALEILPIKVLKKVANNLGISVRVAASWSEGPNWISYNEDDADAGDEAARKFLGDKEFKKLDLTSIDVVLAVLDKLHINLKSIKR